MREIKIRYALKNKENGKITFDYLPLWRIEEGIGDRFDGCEIIGKDEYTGLKDKNGKEIYEKDIVKIHNYETEWKYGEPDFDWRIFKVEWNRITWSFNNDVLYTPLSDYNQKTLEPFDIEIIGNIYENNHIKF